MRCLSLSGSAVAGGRGQSSTGTRVAAASASAGSRLHGGRMKGARVPR
ncbi:hypothetical protein ACFFRL_12560 [Agromyces hippuratus]